MPLRRLRDLGVMRLLFLEYFATFVCFPFFEATLCSVAWWCFLTELSRFEELWTACGGGGGIDGTIIGDGGGSGSAAIGVTAGSGLGAQAPRTANKAATSKSRADLTMYFLLGLGKLYQQGSN